MEGLFGFIVAGFALAGSPGPATLSLAATGAAFGARRGAAYLGGILVGMIGVFAIIASGLLGLLLALPGAAPLVSVAATAYFAYLAYRIATAPPLAAGGQGHAPSFAGGVLLSLANPKGYAAVAALLSGFVLVRAHVEIDTAAKFAVLAAITTTVNVAWLFGGAALTRFFREPGSSRAINVAFAVLLVASVVLAVLV